MEVNQKTKDYIFVCLRCKGPFIDKVHPPKEWKGHVCITCLKDIRREENQMRMGYLGSINNRLNHGSWLVSLSANRHAEVYTAGGLRAEVHSIGAWNNPHYPYTHI